MARKHFTKTMMNTKFRENIETIKMIVSSSWNMLDCNGWN